MMLQRERRQADDDRGQNRPAKDHDAEPHQPLERRERGAKDLHADEEEEYRTSSVYSPVEVKVDRIAVVIEPMLRLAIEEKSRKGADATCNAK